MKLVPRKEKNSITFTSIFSEATLINMETTTQFEKLKEEEKVVVEDENVVIQTQPEEEAHPYAFHVSGPRNLVNLNWRDVISSSW